MNDIPKGGASQPFNKLGDGGNVTRSDAEPTRFRKLPVEIDAVRYDGLHMVGDVPTPMFNGSFDDLPDWLHEAMAKGEQEEGAVFDRDGALIIFTKEGEHRADQDDRIIRGVAGELYPCKPEIFATTYEPVT